MNKKLTLINIFCFLLLINIHAKESIPSVIQSFVDTTNTGDLKGFVNSFSKNAYLRDWFRTFHGHPGVASWNESDNIGKNTHFDILDIQTTKEKNKYILKVKVSGDGFNGISDISFTIKDNLIEKMIISPL